MPGSYRATSACKLRQRLTQRGALAPGGSSSARPASAHARSGRRPQPPPTEPSAAGSSAVSASTSAVRTEGVRAPGWRSARHPIRSSQRPYSSGLPGALTASRSSVLSGTLAEVRCRLDAPAPVAPAAATPAALAAALAAAALGGGRWSARTSAMSCRSERARHRSSLSSAVLSSAAGCLKALADRSSSSTRCESWRALVTGSASPQRRTQASWQRAKLARVSASAPPRSASRHSRSTRSSTHGVSPNAATSCSTLAPWHRIACSVADQSWLAILRRYGSSFSQTSFMKPVSRANGPSSPASSPPPVLTRTPISLPHAPTS